MAVVVQRMVDAMCAGVMFTRSPLTGDKSVITVSKAPGAWAARWSRVRSRPTAGCWARSPARSGCATSPTSMRGRSRRRRRDPETANEAAMATGPCLTDRPAPWHSARSGGRSSGITGGRRTSSGRSTKQRQVFLLQSRPETVWSAKEAARCRGERQSAEPPDEHVRGRR